MDEEALIEAVLRIRASSGEKLTAALVHEKLAAEGVVVELSALKKAASKASKRAPQSIEAPVQSTAKGSGKELKAAKKAAELLKVAASTMMKSNVRLRDRHMLSTYHSEPPADPKAFIEQAVSRAISGVMAADETVSKKRVEADMATLLWLLHPGNTFELPQERRTAAEAQLELIRSNSSG